MNEYTIKKTAIADRWQRYKIQHGEHEEDAVGWLLESPNYIPIVFIFKESHSLNKEHLSLLIKKQFKESKGHFFLIAELVTRLIPKEVKA